jgi:hypothetical protein
MDADMCARVYVYVRVCVCDIHIPILRYELKCAKAEAETIFGKGRGNP